MQETPKMLDVLAESLSVYGRTIRRTWRGLLAVFVPMELVRAGICYAANSPGLFGRKVPSLNNVVGTVLALTIGLIATTLTVRAVLAQYDWPRACAGSDAPRGLWRDWKRLFLTTGLLYLIGIAFVVLLLVGLVGCCVVVRAPLAQVSDVARWTLLGIAVSLECGAVLLSGWLFVRWLFAPVLSLACSACGTSALWLSSNFVRGRFGRCLLYFLLVSLVSSGIGIVPALIATGGNLLQADVWTSPLAPLLLVVADFVTLYSVVALLIFWLRTNDVETQSAVQVWCRRDVAALLALGIGSVVLCVCLMANACSHTRDKARQPYAESLAQLRASVESQTPPCQPTAEEVAAVDAIVSRLGAGTIDGEALLDACNERGLFTAGLTIALQNRLAGRAIAYRRLGLDAVSNWKGDLSASASTPSDRSSSAYEERAGNRIHLFFDEKLKAPVSDLMSGDVLTNVQGRVSRAEGRAVWVQNASGGGPLALDVTSFGLESVRHPLPAFDAATITGDELCRLLGTGFHRERLSWRQCRELRQKLAGRKLTLHDLRVNGSGATWRDGKETGFFLMLKPTVGGRLTFRVSFAKEEDEAVARRLSSAFRETVAELVGTVVADASERETGDDPPVLKMVAEKIVLRHPLEELPPFDPTRVTADDLMAMSASLTNGFTDVLVDDLAQKIGGRELTLTNLTVIGYRQLKLKPGRGVLRAEVRMGDSWNQQLHLCAELSAADVAALPWGFGSNCRIRRLTGKIVQRNARGLESCDGGYMGEISLGDATFEAGWENERLPEFDADTMTGDGFVSLVSKLGAEHRAAQSRQLLRKFSTRRLTFSACEVVAQNVRRSDGRQSCRLGFGKDRRCDFALELDAVAREGDGRIADLGVGVRLKDVSGCLDLDAGDDGMPFFYLADMTFATAAQTDSLPAFDPKTLTGNELVRLLSARRTLLSPTEVRSLQKGLAGRELTIDLTRHEFFRALSGSSGCEDSLREIRFSFIRLNRGMVNDSVVFRLREGIPFSWDSLIRRQRTNYRLTAVVAPMRRADADGRSLVFEDAVLEAVAPQETPVEETPSLPSSNNSALSESNPDGERLKGAGPCRNLI